MISNIFSQNIILENDRVLLRPLQEEDYSLLLPFAIHEPEIWEYSIQQAGSAENLKRYISDAIQNRNAQKEYPFIVFDKKANVYAGSTRFYDIQQAGLSTQLGYTWYGKTFQRTGLNRNCKFLLLQFAFEEWGMERVEFRADAGNLRSINAMKAIGCTVEGVLRSHLPTFKGVRRDSIVLSILKKEWYETVKNALSKKIYS